MSVRIEDKAAGWTGAIRTGERVQHFQGRRRAWGRKRDYRQRYRNRGENTGSETVHSFEK
jgi:hypothetical protein